MTGKRALRITLASFIGLAALTLAAWYATPAVLLWYAEKAFAAKNYARADRALQWLVAIEPNDKRTRFLHARVLRQLERYREADAELDMAAALGFPKDEGVREFGLLWAPKDFVQAEGALQKAARQNPGDVEVLQALTQGYMRQLRPRDTERYLTQWIEVRPDDVQPRLERGRLYLDLREFNKSIADLSEAAKRNPAHYRAHLWLGLALLSDAKIAQAEPELRLCQQMRPDSAEPLVALAECAMERRDYLKARTLLGQALELDYSNLLALQDLGNLNLLEKRYDEAVNNFTQIVTVTPKNKQAHLKLGQALHFLGRTDEARQHEQRFRELDAEEEIEQKKNPMNR